MIWVDTHVHLDCPPLVEMARDVVARAVQVGVTRFLVPGVFGPVRPLPELPGVRPAWGIHPFWAGDMTVEGLKERFSQCSYRPIAIGECGLDRFSTVPPARQEELFVAQIGLAVRLGLPLLIHLRGFWSRALQLLAAAGGEVPVVMHAFSGSWETARLFLDRGAYLSFAGSLCFAGARKTPLVAARVPMDRLLLESDAPDLPPAGWPGLHNEPAAVPVVGERVAMLRGCPPEEIAAATTDNSRRAIPGLFA